MPTLLADITSRDPQRIWASSCAIIHLRDLSELDELADALPRISQTTDGVALGGGLFPSSEHLRHALRKLAFYRNKGGCLCALYPEYILYDPNKEAEQGNVRITRATHDAVNWTSEYICACAVCGRGFKVEQAEYHYAWWQWTVEGPRPDAA